MVGRDASKSELQREQLLWNAEKGEGELHFVGIFQLVAVHLSILKSTLNCCYSPIY